MAALLVEQQQKIDGDLVAALQFEGPESGASGARRNCGTRSSTTSPISPRASTSWKVSPPRSLLQRRARPQPWRLLSRSAYSALAHPAHIRRALSNRLGLGAARYPTRYRRSGGGQRSSGRSVRRESGRSQSLRPTCPSLRSRLPAISLRRRPGGRPAAGCPQRYHPEAAPRIGHEQQESGSVAGELGCPQCGCVSRRYPHRSDSHRGDSAAGHRDADEGHGPRVRPVCRDRAGGAAEFTAADGHRRLTHRPASGLRQQAAHRSHSHH